MTPQEEEKKYLKNPELSPSPETLSETNELAPDLSSGQFELPPENDNPKTPPVAGISVSGASGDLANSVSTQKDDLMLKIEKILEDGLGDAYQELNPTQKQEFKIKGEETAQKIRAALSGAKVKVKKIFQLILEWLKVLPGINKFFLEQEAKIKADKIIGLKDNINYFQ